MTAHDALLTAVLARMRRQHALIGLLFALPWCVGGLLWAVARGWPDGSAAMLLCGVLLLIGGAWWTWRSVDINGIVARLNGDRRDMEDSAGLLLHEHEAIDSPLATLQRARLRQRLQQTPYRPSLAWPRRTLAASAAAALLVFLLGMASRSPTALLQQAVTPLLPAAVAPQAPSLLGHQFRIVPPAYTGLPTTTQQGFDVQVREGSRVTWQPRLQGDIRHAWIAFPDGQRIALARDGQTWQASRTVSAPLLYRIVTEPALPNAQQGLHRIDVIADAAPTIRSIQPTESLSLRGANQQQWTVIFEAEDDIALAQPATLRIVQTQGEGENITFTEHSIALAGNGNRTQRRYAHTFDLDLSGLTRGNDLIAQLIVKDTRTPEPHVVHSTGMILRWPPEAIGEATGLDALIQKQMPAYFRSQRQIIIDIEKLLTQKRSLTPDAFMQRSDAIGMDQHMLRMRYGQFMGEESEWGHALPDGTPHDAEAPPRKPKNTLPTNDVDDEEPVTTADEASAEYASEKDNHDGHALENGHHADDGHDHGNEPPKRGQTMADTANALARELAHLHDIPEAATLLDPETRELLRGALQEMWLSEGQLRSGTPAAALPHAHRALEIIKKAQQAERIYLPRMGSELAPIDMTRRMSGKRDGLASRSNPLLAAPSAKDGPLAQAWLTLMQGPLDATTLQRVAVALQAQPPNRETLDALSALDRLQRDPRCGACRNALRDALWPLLPRPVAAPSLRPRLGAQGDAYLDALERGR